MKDWRTVPLWAGALSAALSGGLALVFLAFGNHPTGDSAAAIIILVGFYTLLAAFLIGGVAALAGLGVGLGAKSGREALLSFAAMGLGAAGAIGALAEVAWALHGIKYMP